LIAPAAPNTGSYAFTVFSCGPGGGGYRLRVTDAAGVASDASDATFSILTDPCALRVTAPAGGERLSPGETFEIAWETSTCCGGAVRLELYRDGSFCRTIAATTPNDGRHTWIVEQCDGLDGNYVLRVRDLLTGAWGESDNHFRIAPYFVCWDGTGEFPSIQAALDAAPEGAIIELCDGTFPGSGNRNLDFRGKSLTLRSRSGNRDACILDCANGGSGIVFDEGEGPLAVVEGITIRRASQGAIVCRNGAAPTIRNCVLRDNVHSAYPGGAGILSESSSPSFTHCTIQDNTLEGGAIAGAGGYLECSEVSFKDCRFLGNRSVNVGGGLNVHGGRLVMEDCFFQGNETSNPGSMGGGGVAVNTWPDCPGEFEFIACRFESNGGFYGGAVLTGGPSRFSGCVFLGNSAGGRGGAISSESGSTLNAIDCLFENNDAGEYGGGCYLWDTDPNAADAFNNCTFRRNISGMGGGGLYIFDCGGAHGTMIVRDCVFEENLAGTHPSWGGGGGAWSFYDNTEFIHCTFTGNQAARGGALLLFYSPAQVRDCEFLDNRATYASGKGGGVLCWSAVTQPAFTSCRFDGNEAPMGGGLAFIEGAGGSLTQCEIVSGRAGRGGGVYCQGAEPRFELCRLEG
ncbi:MAG: right-handed parallel beta-helix repeat-containing protein, partial [Candidatus Eisenbacteria bacterium]|nr:right-handed parallel beta-helix repeat-containing protein [Candidatus Eisenbacteria bacterium]